MTQTVRLYTPRQIEAWSAHASRSNLIARSLQAGYGVGCFRQEHPPCLQAFGILDPPDRLALLYCRGSASRQGHASAILDRLEARAHDTGIAQLRTEASQLSRPLLLRRGWRVEAEETVEIGGESFVRWRMIKALSPSPAGGDRGRG
ncbi:GNAT family N-acetyltransferase [Cyanobium sp. NIES-981]|uniref:GNAT family N-acetyltransferase n=1 Tax=Cyanobium sp. NIES-981 TaxID=1851505 RepID=UPI001CECAEB1|nr:GNAT family N-acetyltransferase [Cyanobium sp. NIES-981]